MHELSSASIVLSENHSMVSMTVSHSALIESHRKFLWKSRRILQWMQENLSIETLCHTSNHCIEIDLKLIIGILNWLQVGLKLIWLIDLNSHSHWKLWIKFTNYLHAFLEIPWHFECIKITSVAIEWLSLEHHFQWHAKMKLKNNTDIACVRDKTDRARKRRKQKKKNGDFMANK